MVNTKNIICALIMCMIMISAQNVVVEAVTCGQVASNLGSCIPYLKGGPGPSGQCCGGIKTLNGLAKTTPDRQTACNCLKSESASISGINYALASGLPSKCGVSVPYTISPSVDCSKVR
uniref:Non-specific lipid-transfer protein n=1 Tax=Dianthus caryophyllus TaxID=3570 RepID=D4QD76_DIACA|nr:lipid transfer protein [Dianthus caryophyllus]